MVIKESDVHAFPDGRVNTKGAASYLGLSEKTLAMMRCNGNGPKYIKRGRVFYFLKELDAWLRAGEVSSTSQPHR